MIHATHCHHHTPYSPPRAADNHIIAPRRVDLCAPQASRRITARYSKHHEAIPQKYHSRIKLHGHFELVHSFNLGGLHLNSRCPTPPVGYSDKLSRSCHTPQELSQATGLEYATLSPVYPSISKPGYLPVLTTDQIISALAEAKVPVVALGGVTPDKESELMHMGFAGYACLGSVWQQFSDK